MDTFLTAEQAAELLRLHVKRIQALARAGRIPATRVGRKWLFSRAALEARLGAAPAVVFVDLPSGSCALEARRVARARPATAVVCGVNLPMLLDFVFHRDLPLETLVPRLLERGRGGILGEVAAESADADRSAPR